MKTIVKCKWMVILLGCSLVACEDFIDINQPSTQIIADEVFTDKKMVDATLAENYIRLRDRVLITGGNNGLGVIMGLYTDELQNWLVSNSYQQALFTNSLTDSESELKNLWDDSYQIIYQCNKIIEGVSSSKTIEESDKNRFIAEAYFVRVLIHFYLSQIWGDIPYVSSSDYTINSKIRKNSVATLNTVFIEEATKALELIKDVPVTNNYRPNSKVVEALLARMYLYQKNWNQALIYADAVISSGSYIMENDLSKVFLKQSTGTIWQLKAAIEGMNTLEAQNYIFTTTPPPSISLSPQLIASFDKEDKRKDLWIGKPEGSQADYFYSNKYKERQNTSASKEYSIIFRIEEMYFIRLEANLHLGNLEQALKDWNLLRIRYGLPIFELVPQNWEVLLLEERRHEFFCEFGHRFFDLKRTGYLNSQMVQTKANWQSFLYQWALPQAELLLNPNLLPQNEGY